METFVRFFRVAALGGALLMMGGCAPDLTVRRQEPAVFSSGKAVQVLLGHASARQPAADREQREATASLIAQDAPALLAAPGHTLRIPGAVGGGSVRLSLRRGPGPGGVDPDQFAGLQPADDYRVRSASGLDRTPGAGVPLVATLRPVLPIGVAGPVPPRPVPGLTWAVTALPVVRPADRSGERIISLDLYDPHDAAPTVRDANGHARPLAADYSTPLAVTFARFGPQRRGWRGFLGLGKQDFSSAGIYATELPTPDKTPLVLVHGLISDPTDFHDLQNRLESDPSLRRHYQVWIFYYPTSLPVPYSATELREDLAAFVHRLDPGGTHPALHRALLVGHSMGGLLCRLAVSDGGDRYYDHFFRQPVERLRLTADQRDLVRRTFYYRAEPDVAQVVFIATPHRGSRLTGGVLGAFGRLLVRVPLTVRTEIERINTANRAALVPGAPLKPASSINSLSPRDPVILALQDLPIRPGVGLHTIQGNRGRDGPRDRSSDGVVPYASSHLPQARSEVQVPAGHTGTLQRPETAAEILRIVHQTRTKDQG